MHLNHLALYPTLERALSEFEKSWKLRKPDTKSRDGGGVVGATESIEARILALYRHRHLRGMLGEEKATTLFVLAHMQCHPVRHDRTRLMSHPLLNPDDLYGNSNVHRTATYVQGLYRYSRLLTVRTERSQVPRSTAEDGFVWWEDTGWRMERHSHATNERVKKIIETDKVFKVLGG